VIFVSFHLGKENARFAHSRTDRQRSNTTSPRPPTDRQSLTQSHPTPPNTKNNPKEKIPQNLALSKPLRFFVLSNTQQGKHNNITTNTARQPTR
jgi:hypothetical protein